MARPKTKEELINAADRKFEQLWEVINSLPKAAITNEFDFSSDLKKKEAHWKRDRNIRDVLTHLYEWHQLLLNWINSNIAGNFSSFLPEPYNWKTYGEFNMDLWRKHQNTHLRSAKEMLETSHKTTLELIRSFTNEELFTKQHFNWTGTTTLGSYCVSAMPSHYDWATKKIRAHIKNVSGNNK